MCKCFRLSGKTGPAAIHSKLAGALDSTFESPVAANPAFNRKNSSQLPAGLFIKSNGRTNREIQIVFSKRSTRRGK